MKTLLTRGGFVAAGLVVAYVLPYLLGVYLMHVVDVALIFALLAVGLSLTLGISGQINLAQGAFFGIGAYASAILTTHSHVDFWLAGLLAVVLTVVSSLIIGIPALRVQSHYLAIVTLGLSLAFVALVSNWDLAGRASGLVNLPVPPLGGVDLSSDYIYYYLEVVVLALALPFAYFVTETRLGRRLKAMRDDNLAAASTGVQVPIARMVAFALGGLFGGLAGVLYAGLIRYVSPDSFGISNMFLLLAMVIIGGRFSLNGALVGVAVLSVVREELADYSAYAQLVYGALIVVMVIFAPTGLVGAPARLRERLSRGRTAKSAKSAKKSVMGAFIPSATTTVTPSEGEYAVEIDALTKNFSGVKALTEVSLSVRVGEIRGVVGPNGSGKTTLFNTISGLYKPTSGQVRMFGERQTGSAPYRLSLLGIARTFQNLRLFGRLTVRDNVLVGLDRTPLSWSWRYVLNPFAVWRSERVLRSEAEQTLTQYGLTEVADAEPGELPYGTQRRVEIARAMAAAPRLLLLDEPAAGLNRNEANQLADIIRDVRDRGTTVILIEHNMGLVMSLCDQVTVLANGVVIADSEPASVANDPAVIEAYLGESGQVDLPSPDAIDTASRSAQGV